VFLVGSLIYFLVIAISVTAISVAVALLDVLLLLFLEATVAGSVICYCYCYCLLFFSCPIFGATIRINRQLKFQPRMATNNTIDVLAIVLPKIRNTLQVFPYFYQVLKIMQISY